MPFPCRSPLEGPFDKALKGPPQVELELLQGRAAALEEQLAVASKALEEQRSEALKAAECARGAQEALERQEEELRGLREARGVDEHGI